jgi:hypothetical protein
MIYLTTNEKMYARPTVAPVKSTNTIAECSAKVVPIDFFIVLSPDKI